MWRKDNGRTTKGTAFGVRRPRKPPHPPRLSSRVKDTMRELRQKPTQAPLPHAIDGPDLTPHANIVTDPIGHLARCEEAFHGYSVGSGFDILRGDHGIESASDAQNRQAAWDSFQRSDHFDPPSNHFDLPLEPAHSPVHQPEPPPSEQLQPAPDPEPAPDFVAPIPEPGG